jgi:hypothetical protein
MHTAGIEKFCACAMSLIMPEWSAMSVLSFCLTDWRSSVLRDTLKHRVKAVQSLMEFLEKERFLCKTFIRKPQLV